jgi:hypothetical protein
VKNGIALNKICIRFQCCNGNETCGAHTGTPASPKASMFSSLDTQSLRNIFKEGSQLYILYCIYYLGSFMQYFSFCRFIPHLSKDVTFPVKCVIINSTHKSNFLPYASSAVVVSCLYCWSMNNVRKNE